MRAVKSLSTSAAGPMTRRTSWNASVVAYSTMRRAGRSVRLQTIAASAVISPLATPHGIAGRVLSAVMIAGAVPCATTRREPNAPASAATPAMVIDERNARRLTWIASVVLSDMASPFHVLPTLVVRGQRLGPMIARAHEGLDELA